MHGYAHNQIWCEIAAMASELLAWMALLALPATARRWGPKRLRLRLFAPAGCLARGGGACGCASPSDGPGTVSSPPRSASSSS